MLWLVWFLVLTKHFIMLLMLFWTVERCCLNYGTLLIDMLWFYKLLININTICDWYHFPAWITIFFNIGLYFAKWWKIAMWHALTLSEINWHEYKMRFVSVSCLDQKFYKVLLNYGEFLKNMLWHYMYKLFKDINIDSDLRPFLV